MSLNSLLESANPYHSMQSDAAKLATKWEKTGLLEGLGGAHKNNMGVILENQAKQLVVEQSSTGGGAASSGTFSSQTSVNIGGQWAGVALPLVRKVFGQIAAQEFVSVQPMNLPSGLVFYLDFQYGSAKTPFAAGSSLYGDKNAIDNPFGNTNEGGLYGSGRFGYSVQNTESKVEQTGLVAEDATWDEVNFNSTYSASVAAGEYWALSVPTSSLAYGDFEGVKGFNIFTGSLTAAVITGSDGTVPGAQLSEFTDYDGGANVKFVVSKSKFGVDGASSTASVWVNYQLQPTDQYRGDFEAGNSPIIAVFGMKTTHIMSEVAYQNAQIDLLIARYQLHKVLGLVDPIIQ